MKHMRILMAAAAVAVASTLGTASAQQLWLSAGAQKSLSKKLKASVELEHRSDDNFAATSRWSADAGLSYRITPWLKAGADYVYLLDREGNRTTKKGNYIPHYWEQGHRAQAKLTASYKIGPVELSLRETYQFTHTVGQTVNKFDQKGRPKDPEVIPSENDQVLRSRIQAEYTISKKCPLTPYASYEIYNDLVSRFNVDKQRYTVGAEYRLSRSHSVSAYYRYSDRPGTEGDVGSIIGAGYEFKF